MMTTINKSFLFHFCLPESVLIDSCMLYSLWLKLQNTTIFTDQAHLLAPMFHQLVFWIEMIKSENEWKHPEVVKVSSKIHNVTFRIWRWQTLAYGWKSTINLLKPHDSVLLIILKWNIPTFKFLTKILKFSDGIINEGLAMSICNCVFI